MDINKLLQYQAIDNDYEALLKERNNTPEVSKYLKAKKVRDLSTQSLIKLNNDSKQIYSKMESLLNEYKELSEEVDAILESINQINEIDSDSEEIDFLGHRLETLTGEINTLLRDVSFTSERVAAIRKDYERDAANATGGRKLMKELNDVVSKILDEYKPKMDALSEMKNKMKTTMSAEDIELYEKISSAKKGAPAVVVPLTNGTYCGGCLREMAKGQIQEVGSEKGYTICQECSRIVYDPERFKK